MITATRNDLLTYVANLIEIVERYGATVLPPNDEAVIALEEVEGDLQLELSTRLPGSPRSADVDLALAELWTQREKGVFALTEYAYELRNHELNYRRALHRHDVDYFVATYDVVIHEHCEATLDTATCGHYAAVPVNGAIEGFFRLYDVWLVGVKPECSELRCLG